MMTMGTLVLLLAGLAFYTVRNQLSDSLLSYYQAQEITVAMRTANFLRTDIETLKGELIALGNIPEIRNGKSDICNTRLLQEFEVLKSSVGNIGRIGKDGRFYCTVNSELMGVEGSTLGSYISEIFNDPEHKPVLSRRVLAPGAGGYAIALHIPIFDDKHEFQGTLGGAIYMKEFEKKYLIRTLFNGTGYIALVDDNGDILYHPNEDLIGKNISSEFVQKAIQYNKDLNFLLEAAKKGQQGTKQYVFDNQKKVAAYAPVQLESGRKFGVIVAAPISDVQTILVNTDINKIFLALFIALLILFIIQTTILSAYVLESLIDPLESITESNHELEDTIKTRTIELEKSKEGFEEAVEKRTENLKNKTTELENANAKLKETNEYMIDRELKMKEMKKELEELKKGTV